MLAEGTRSLPQALWGLESETWKTKPKLALLMRYSGFYKEIFNVCPGGMILHTTMMAAIEFLDKDAECMGNASIGMKHDHYAACSNIIRFC